LDSIKAIVSFVEAKIAASSGLSNAPARQLLADRRERKPLAGFGAVA
jgi:hypothetical protein